MRPAALRYPRHVRPVALAMVACAVTGTGCRQLFGIDDTTVGDDGPDAGDPSTPDATPPVDACMLDPIGSVDPCALGTPEVNMILDGMLATDTDPRCRSYSIPGGVTACAFYADGITVPEGASLIVTGSRPLLLVSTSDIAIDGQLDVSSHVAG